MLLKDQIICSGRAVFAGKSPPAGVIPARMSAIAVRAEEEEEVVQDVIEKTQISNKSKI